MFQFTTPEKDDLLKQIRHEFDLLESLIRELPAEAVPGEGGWDVKAVLAHVALWDHLTAVRLQAAQRGERPAIPPTDSDADIDRLNARVLEETRPRLFAQVLEEFTAAHSSLVAAIETCDGAFLRSDLPAEWGGGWKVWELIAANTIWHYPEHAETLESWRKKTS